MSITSTSSFAPSQAASASQSSSGQTFSEESDKPEDSIDTAISGLTSLVEAGRSAAGAGRSPAANYIQGAMDLYASMEENETLSIEELKEQLRLSEDPLIRDLADDSVFLAEMDATGFEVEPDGKVSKSDVGNFLVDAYRRVKNILDGKLTEGDYGDLTVLAAEDASLGQGILGELTGKQRRDLSHWIAADPELIKERALVPLPPSAYNPEEAYARARELAPDAGAERQKVIANILYSSVTQTDYTALKKLFAEDPSLGARVLEEIAPQQAQISKHLSSDLELRKNPEDWSEGFRSLMGDALPASRKLLAFVRPWVTQEQIDEVLGALDETIANADVAIAYLNQIVENPREVEQEEGMPEGTLDTLRENASEIRLELERLRREARDARSAIQGANNSVDDRNAVHTGVEAYHALRDHIENRVRAVYMTVGVLRETSKPENQPDPDEAGPSGLRPIEWTPDDGVTRVVFSAQSQSEVEQELLLSRTFRDWAALSMPGWSIAGVAAFIGRHLWNGERTPRIP